MRRIFADGLPMQPGEESWASWKCGGGPHSSEFEPVRATEQLPVRPSILTRTVEVHDVSDAQPITPRTVEIGVANEFMAHLPA